MQGEGLYCPDYSRDISIRVRDTDSDPVKPKGEKGKKRKKFPPGFDFL